MYRAFLNDEIFFDSAAVLDSLKLTAAGLVTGANSAGTFTFTIPPQNIKHGSFHLLADWVSLYRDDVLIFHGRVYSVSKTFETLETVVCEGALAVLNDSIQRPFTHNGSLADLVAYLINIHNTQSRTEKQVTVGNITVSDEVAYRVYDNPETTMARLMDLVDSYGGYMSMRYEDNALYLDWLADVSETSAQSVDFGKNLLDVVQESGADELITVLIPYGAETENADGTKSKVDIKSVNNDLDYIENTEAMEAYERIVGTHEWDDVTVPAHLLAKARAYLNEKSRQRLTLNVTAVDLKNAGMSSENFRVGKKIIVNSEAHGISGREFICKSLNINLLDPTSDRLVLGDEIVGMLSGNITQGRKNAKIIQNINAAYARNEKVQEINNLVEEARQNIIELNTLIEQTAEQISLKAEKSVVDGMTAEITSMWTAINQTAETIGIYFGSGGKIDSWFTFDENKFQIGKAGSAIHSEQDNQSYRFVNENGDILLEINPDGTISETVDVNAQVRFKHGETNQWSIRKGKYISGKGINLNDIWIG